MSSKFFTLVLTKSGKETIYMTDTMQRVKARKKALETSQRGKRTNYSIRPALEDEEKYRRPPNMNFCPSGDAGTRGYRNRKAKAKRIKQKNPRKDKLVEPRIVETPPEHYRYCGTSLREAEDMREEIELYDEVAAWVVQCDGIYYTIYAD